MPIKKILLLLLLVVFTNTFAKDSKPLIVALDWFVNPNHAPLFVALDQGFFKEHGLSVQFVPPADPTDAEKMVLTRNADIAVTYQPSLVIAAQRGASLIQLGTLINHPLSCLMVLEKSSIKNLKEFKGKKIGTTGTTIEKAQLLTMLKHAGLNLSDIELVNVRFNLVQGLLTGRIDGCMGAMRNFEPILIQENGERARLFYPENYGFPYYDELVFAINKNQIADPRLTKFLQAVKLGTKYLLQHPEECWKKFAKAHPELNNQLNKESWFKTLPYFATKPEDVDKKQYQVLAKFMAFIQQG